MRVFRYLTEWIVPPVKTGNAQALSARSGLNASGAPSLLESRVHRGLPEQCIWGACWTVTLRRAGHYERRARP